MQLLCTTCSSILCLQMVAAQHQLSIEWHVQLLCTVCSSSSHLSMVTAHHRYDWKVGKRCEGRNTKL